MENSKFLKEMESYFSVAEHNDCVELETWTDGGVNMIININKDDTGSYFEQFNEYVEDFDMDEEIELHRQDNGYKAAFTIKQSVNDFEAFERRLETILNEI